jgi:hypothetical protein
MLQTSPNVSAFYQVTFAAHLLFGTYLLGSLAMETLEATEDSRLIVVSRSVEGYPSL